jgi:hypothetical protein
MFDTGAIVELRTHARRAEDVPQVKYGEGKILGVRHDGRKTEYQIEWPATFDGDGYHAEIVEWRPASHLKLVQFGGSRARHDELYTGERCLKKRVEEAGVELRAAMRELYVPDDVHRWHGRDRVKWGEWSIGIDGVDLFDARREAYEALVAEFLRKTRRHEQDNCC